MTPSYCFEAAVYIRELFTCQLSLPNALQIQLVAATKSLCVWSVVCLTVLTALLFFSLLRIVTFIPLVVSSGISFLSPFY